MTSTTSSYSPSSTIEWYSELFGPEKIYAEALFEFPKGSYNMVHVFSLQSTCISKELLMNNVQLAWLRVHRRHPILQAVIPRPTHLGQALFFVKFKNKNELPPVRVVNDMTEWKALQEQEMNMPFHYMSPLYRVAISGDASVVMVTVHHCLTDAGGCCSFLTDWLSILDAYNQLALPKADAKTIQHELDSIPNLPLPECGYSYVSHKFPKVSLTTAHNAVHNAWTLLSHNKESMHVVFEFKPAMTSQTKTIDFALDKTKTQAILAACKKNGVTVAHFLAGLTAKTLLDAHAKRNNVDKYDSHVHLSCGRDLRKNLDVDYPEANVRVCSSNFLLSVHGSDQSTIWDLAKNSKKHMDAALAAKEDISDFLLCNSGSFHWIQRSLNQTPIFPVMIGSIGQFDTNYKTMNADLISTALAVHDVLDTCSLFHWTSNDQMHFCMSYSTHQNDDHVKQWFNSIWTVVNTQFL